MKSVWEEQSEDRIVMSVVPRVAKQTIWAPLLDLDPQTGSQLCVWDVLYMCNTLSSVKSTEALTFLSGAA